MNDEGVSVALDWADQMADEWAVGAGADAAARAARAAGGGREVTWYFVEAFGPSGWQRVLAYKTERGAMKKARSFRDGRMWRVVQLEPYLTPIVIADSTGR